ncbi:MAG: branched-chain amino acid transaminase [Acidobacteriota bacterium]|nr:branched-chain amino acid transaminase [Acidobacteriota bacterium]
MTFEESKWVWMDGRVIPWHNATTHVSAHALHYGSGVFEGMRCYETSDGPAVFRLDAHLDRLYSSAEIYGITIPYTREELTNGVNDIVRLNNFRSCYVRPICYLGSGNLGVHPGDNPVEVVILAWLWAPYLGAEGLKQGVRVTVSPWRKFESRMMPTTAKACGQYLNSMLAVRDAVSRGYAEALLLDAEGHLAEGSGENLFIVRDGQLLTNDERHSILLGITRDAVLRIARDLGYRVEVRALHMEDLLSAAEAFFTGTAAEVTPIREVDGATIGNGTPGPVTDEIQRVFFAATSGRDQRYQDWLHRIDSQPDQINRELLQSVLNDEDAVHKYRND